MSFFIRLFFGKEDHQEAQGIECYKCKVKGLYKTATCHCTVCKVSLCDACSSVHQEQNQLKLHDVKYINDIDFKLCTKCLKNGKRVLVYLEHLSSDNPLCCLCTEYASETDVDRSIEWKNKIPCFGDSPFDDNNHGKDKQCGRANDSNTLQSSDSDYEEWHDAETTKEQIPRKLNDGQMDIR